MTEARDAVATPDLAAASAALEGKSPQEILRWASEEYQPGLTLACSFGGPSGMVLLDMMMQIDRDVEVFYLDTDFLFPETYKLRDIAAAKYDFQPTGYMSLLTPPQQAQKHGDALWARDPDACCAIRKVEPNERALAGKTRLDQRHPARPVDDARGHRHRRVGRQVRPGENQPAGIMDASRTSGSTSWTTACHTTSCTTTATLASAARTARSR